MIAVPPFRLDFLLRGHAVRFRCRHAEAEGMRVDVMARMRGVAPFPELWERRTTLEAVDGSRYDLLSLPDLLAAKKTQRDKDWPMIRRLIEADVAAKSSEGPGPTPEDIRFWLSQARTPSILEELCRDHPLERDRVLASRPCLAFVGDESRLEEALHAEEIREREADRAYWAPLRRELEDLRRILRPEQRS